MAKKLGDLVKLEVSADNITFTEVEFQQGGTTTRSASPADVSNKDSNRWAEAIAGFRNWELSATGVWSDGATGQEIIRNAWEDGSDLYAKFVQTLGAVENSGQVLVTDFSEDDPHDAASAISMTLQGTGALTNT